MLAQKLRAEGVGRQDIRAGKARKLRTQMARAGILQKRGGQRVRDLAAHFACSGAREGDDQETVDVDRVFFVRDEAQEALDEHGGLAGARRCGDENGMPVRVDRALLFIGPFGHYSASFPASSKNSFAFLFGTSRTCPGCFCTSRPQTAR